MARVLIVGCGCRGTMLARELLARGHAVRGTTRRPQRLAELERSGVEAVLADPDRIATLFPAFDHVAVACVLLASATGDPDAVAALHTTRLDMLLTKLLDSTVRGVVYEAAGTAPSDVLADGARRVRAFCEDSRVPYCLLEANPGDGDGWCTSAVGAVERVLEPRL